MAVGQKAEPCSVEQRWGQNQSRKQETVGKASGLTGVSGEELGGSSSQGLLEVR